MAKHVLSLFVMHIKRNRTPLKYIGYGLYFYFLGLSYRNTSKALSQFVKRSHVAVWKWIQKYHPKRIISTRKKIEEYLVDETLIKVGSKLIWLWVAIEPKTDRFSHYPYPWKEVC